MSWKSSLSCITNLSFSTESFPSVDKHAIIHSILKIIKTTWTSYFPSASLSMSLLLFTAKFLERVFCTCCFSFLFQLFHKAIAVRFSISSFLWNFSRQVCQGTSLYQVQWSNLIPHLTYSFRSI